jgi:hypothetical protein
VGKEGMMIPYSLKEHVAECYRHAEDYGRLCQRASNSKERETLWFTRQHFLLLAGVLERKLSKLQAAPERTGKKLPGRRDTKLTGRRDKKLTGRRDKKLRSA